MSRIVHIDAVAGVAGDMLLAALIDCGADADRLNQDLAPLGVRIEVGQAERHGILARTVTVRGNGEPEGGHVHRTLGDVLALLAEAGLAERPRRRAESVFRALAEAEGRVHGIEPERVHFHEVGAIDSIGDVCGIALALEQLSIDQLSCSSLPCPSGLVEAAHGRLPLPAPATAELLRGHPVHGVELDVELVTPTGAAVIAALATVAGSMPAMRLESTGYGAGSREIEAIPNLTRVMVGELAARATRGSVSLVETNLDDLPPEIAPDAVSACFDAGALDVWITPAQMKKGRPGVVLSALARPGGESAVAEAILRETTALGVRVGTLSRWELDREWDEVEVAGHQVRVKLGKLEGEVVNVAPEHDDCLEVARQTGRTVKAVWAEALAAAERITEEERR